MSKRPLSAVDVAWLRMEDPTNLMMISGILVFGTPMDYDRLRTTLECTLLDFRRFRQRVVQPQSPLRTPYWEDDPCFDLDNHLERISLPAPADRAAIQDLASALASTQLDSSRPLWHFLLVENYEEGCALICRLHHCIGDGLALVHVLLSLTDSDPDAPWPEASAEAEEQAVRPRRRRLFRRSRSVLRKTRQATCMLLREGCETLTHPDRIGDLVHLGADGAKAAAVLALRWPDPKTVFKGPLGVSKRAAWTEPLPLQDVKIVGKELGGTVNDVLLTAMAGGLRRYLQSRDEPVDGLDFRAIIPVNLRPTEDKPRLGNRFGLVFLSLPIGIAEPDSRLLEVKRRMNGLKGSLEAPVAFGILNAIGMSPEPIQDLVVSIFGTKGTAVMTNVMGPREQLYLAGAPLEALMFWVPQSARLGIGVSILSYAGKVWMGVITDVGLVPDPETIVEGFHAEFDDLLALARKAQETPSLREIAARLDEVTATLDAVLEKRGAQQAPGPVLAPDADKAEVEPPEAADRCEARTKTGKPCKNRPLAGSRFCRVHQG